MNDWPVGLNICTHIYLNDYCGSLSICMVLLRDPIFEAPIIVFCKDVNGIFYRVYHAYMTPVLKGSSPRPTNQDILEDEPTRTNHVVDVLPICYYIVAIGRKVVYREYF